MKTRKIPLRKSVVSNEVIDKRDLLRIVKNKEGQVFIDPTGKANGRGAYIKLDNAEVISWDLLSEQGGSYRVRNWSSRPFKMARLNWSF